MVKRYLILLFWLVLSCVVLFLFRAAFSQFFSADDWFHLRISSIDSVREFFHFFSFAPSEQSAAFYRPLPTQVFFFILHALFGLNALGWYIVVLCTFIACLYLFFVVLQRLADTRVALFSTVLYAISHTNSTRLYFLSAYQELSLVAWTLLCIIGFLQRKQLIWRAISICSFWLALLSKETAVVLPAMLAMIIFFEHLQVQPFAWSRLAKQLWLLWPYGVSLLLYLILRLVFFGLETAGHQSYEVSFQPSQVANTLMWYSTWALGAPETLQNYVANFTILDRWWSDFPTLGQPIIWLLIASIAGSGILVVSYMHTLWNQMRSSSKTVRTMQNKLPLLLLGTAWFLLPLLPVLFFPQHKFALELGVPLFGSCLVLAILISHKRYLGLIVFCVLVILNIFSIELTARNHYSVLRSQTARHAYTYFSQHHPQLPHGSVVRFVNDRTDLPNNWGVSKQVSESLQGSEFFAVLYPNKDVLAEYEDLPHTVSEKQPDIVVGSSQFLY